MNTLRRLCASAAAVIAALCMLAPSPARAEYPEQNIRIIVPYAAGGFTDAFARIVAERLSPILGKPVVVENRPGASGKLAHDYVAGLAPDGYTLVLDVVTLPTLMPLVEPGVPQRDMLKTFSVVGQLGSTALVMVVPASAGVKDFKAFSEKMKNEPKKHSFGSSGTGTQTHVMGQQLMKLQGLDLVHVPYRGGGPAVQDMLAGQLMFLIDTPPTVLPSIQSGALVPLAVVYPQRIKQLPNIPTAEEAGITQFRDQGTSTYLMATAGTPKAVIDKINGALQQVGKDQSFIDRLDTIGLIPPPPNLTAEGAHDLAGKQIEAWARAVKVIQQ